MNLIKFPVASTNIFPVANSTAGGQLVTEYNLRSRESVSTRQDVPYMIGPSFVHSETDFALSKPDNTTAVLRINKGRGVINGHFIETFSDVDIDLLQENMEAASRNDPELSGQLRVGLRAFYSTALTMAGALAKENDAGLYEGIQIVILPVNDFKLPSSDVQEADVTAHLWLGDISFINGKVSLGDTNGDKCRYLPASRIADSEDFLSTKYVTRDGLQTGSLYIFSGKGVENEDVPDLSTWCQANDSLMIWDNNPEVTSDATKVGPEEATFAVTKYLNGSDHGVALVIPHKQVDGYTDQSGNPLYFACKSINLPDADYNNSKPGIVTSAFINSMKQIETKINQYYTLPAGKQVMYIDTLESEDDLPIRIDADWKTGDYILVRNDLTVVNAEGPVSTMYVIRNARRITAIDNVRGNPDAWVFNTWNEAYAAMQGGAGEANQLIASATAEGNAEYYPDSGLDVNTDIFNVSQNDYYAEARMIGKNGFIVEYIGTYTSGGTQRTRTSYYVFWATAEGTSGKADYAQIVLTGYVPFATETAIGGFLNINNLDADVEDGGYVYRDSDGHLRLLDYALLREGQLAYQLGQDFETSAALTVEGQQEELDEYVNQRVAFLTATETALRRKAGTDLFTVTVTLNVPEHSDSVVYTIQGIDSRFGTAVVIKMTGYVDSNVNLLVSNCEKIRLDRSVIGSTIGVIGSSLYYDADVIDSLTAASNMTLWYERKDDLIDPNITVSGLVVTSSADGVTLDEVDFWHEQSGYNNDNHFYIKLKSLIFDSTLHVIGATALVKDTSTENVSAGDLIYVASSLLPNTLDLPYPASRIRPLLIEGSFVNGYRLANTNKFMLIDHDFSCKVLETPAGTTQAPMTLALHTHPTEVVMPVGSEDIGSTIDGWDVNNWYQIDGHLA